MYQAETLGVLSVSGYSPQRLMVTLYSTTEQLSALWFSAVYPPRTSILITSSSTAMTRFPSHLIVSSRDRGSKWDGLLSQNVNVAAAVLAVGITTTVDGY